jgi:hypothetical protein
VVEAHPLIGNIWLMGPVMVWPKKIPLNSVHCIKKNLTLIEAHSFIGIIGLMGSVMVWPKKIPLSGVHCIKQTNVVLEFPLKIIFICCQLNHASRFLSKS